MRIELVRAAMPYTFDDAMPYTFDGMTCEGKDMDAPVTTCLVRARHVIVKGQVVVYVDALDDGDRVRRAP